MTEYILYSYYIILYFSIFNTPGMSHLKNKVLPSANILHYTRPCNTPEVETRSLRNLTIIHSSFSNAFVKVQMFSRSMFCV